MITIDEYRKKINTKRKKLRNWVIFTLISLFAVSFVLLLSLVIKQNSKLHHENNTNDKELSINLTEIDINNNCYDKVISEITKISQVSSLKNIPVKIFLEGKLICYYLLNSPDVSVLNGKGENNLAMNVSIKLLKEGINIRNYGNYVSNIEKSIIINRTPNHHTAKLISDKLKIPTISNLIFDKTLENNLSGIIIILGRDFNLSNTLDN